MALEIDEYDILEGPYGDEFGPDELHIERRGERRTRGVTGPTEVFFSVYLGQAPAAHEAVKLKGSLPELEQGVWMQPCETGQGRLWRCSVQLTPPANAAGAGSAGLPGGGGMFTGLGVLPGVGLGGGAGPLGRSSTPLFDVTYALCHQATGAVLKQDESPTNEFGPLKQCYYHRARFAAGKVDAVDDQEAFPLFVHDEIHLLQSGAISGRDFLQRFLQLAQAPFARRRSLLEKAVEDLIFFWGEDVRPPFQTVLAIAACLGYFRRQHTHGPSPLFEDIADMGAYPHPGAAGSSLEKDREPPPSLVVCRWIVKHCPARSDLQEEDRLRERDRSLQLQRLSNLGVLQAAETLYIGEKTFDWLRLLSFLPEHTLPPPLNASLCDSEQRDKLVRSFLSTMGKVLRDFQDYLIAPRPAATAAAASASAAAGGAAAAGSAAAAAAAVGEETKDKERQKHETSLKGLCAFCPSVDCLHELVRDVLRYLPSLWETVTPMFFNRLRFIHFGPQDKDALRRMIQEVPIMHADDTAIALLANQHHPSDGFKPQEIINFVKLVTESKDGVRSAGPQLQSAMRRWLLRFYGRPPDRHERKDEGGAGGGSRVRRVEQEYQMRKADILQAIRRAIEAWHMVLVLPCFRQEDETLRMILFELSQAYFFKDPDPILVLDCMLDLEDDIRRKVTVKQLETELQRIAVKSVRDASDTSETEFSEELLNLLFERPTLLRFHIIEAFIGFKGASSGLAAILANEPIWTRLLSPAWMEAQAIGDALLGSTQRSGKDLLTLHASQLQNGSIQLSHLRTILQGKQVYEKLVRQVSGTSPQNIPDSQAKLNKFDAEFAQLRVYVTLFCNSAGIEVGELSQLIDGIHTAQGTLELRVAEKKFEGLPVREHLPWLYPLRGSDVFAGIWKATASAAEQKDQEYVVRVVIPLARAKWEALAKSVEDGTVILQEISWCVDYEWAKVQHELKLLEQTAPKQGPWADRAVELTRAMRLAAKLREWAPSMLHLREKVLSELFSAVDADAKVEELNSVVRKSEAMWSMQLRTMLDHVEPHRATINMLTEPMQDYTILMARHDGSLTWLLGHRSTDDFNRLISLCRPNTDDAVILAAIASLQQTRTFLANVLYEAVPYKTLEGFLTELAKLSVDETVHLSLEKVHKSFDPMLELLTTHSRTPGVQACYDLKKIHENGRFIVFCSLKDSKQLVCRTPEEEFSYEKIAELRRQLLMTDVPAELDGATNLPQMLEELVEKLSLLEEFGRCTMQLFALGHFAYHEGQQVLEVSPQQTVETVGGHLNRLQQKLADWQTAVDAARDEHYFLNYFTVREICFLVSALRDLDRECWERIWPLLHVVDLCATEDDVRDKIKRSASTALLSQSGTGEEGMLKAFGSLLGELFEDSKPMVRPLERLRPARQQLQGDLLIRSMQRREEGIPVFVCCADDPSKVTELVLSIYARRERVPEAEELLLCSSHTTVEEIELLLRRFFSAQRHKREERLYCLGNVHLLPYVVQCGTVEALRRLEEKFNYADASALVFVSGLQNQMLTNALNRHNLAVSVLPQENLQEAVARVGEKYHGRQMEAVCAEMNGVGKTHHIYRQIQKAQQSCDDQPVMHHVEIRETTDISSLVTALLSDPTDPKLPTAIHLDLAHILPSHVDTLLFELLVVGMLRDTQHNAVYHRRSKDFFMVEVPNTPSELIAKQLSFCLILPRTFLRMTADAIDAELPVIKSVPVNGDESRKAPFVKFEANKNLELVGKTLEAMKRESFNPRSQDFNVGWTAATAPAISTQLAYEHLKEVCSSETSPPSFLVFMNFVKFLGSLVSAAEAWNMMNLNLLQNFDPGLKHFKHCFFRLLIETSRDFALRQVPKQMTIEASPLAPPMPALTRATSGMSRTESHGPGHPPALQRQWSRAVDTQAHAEADSQVENSGVGRIGIGSYVERFDKMPSWEDCMHPVACFKKNEYGTIIGCSIMSLKKPGETTSVFLNKFIDKNLQNSLNLNDLKLDKDWSQVTHVEAVQLVHQIEGGELLKKKDHAQTGPKDYVVTVDNLLKLMSIQQRLKYGLPVILMGETGCGKTALVKFLSRTLEFKLHLLDIHGGITDSAIMEFLDKAVAEAEKEKGVLVFFDEINAANCMALFKTIIIDRVYGNKQIPDSVRIISCCNPYRLRKGNELEDVALVFQHHATGGTASGITDPMKKLVYRVHPLPESLIDVVSDFGSLSERSENLYISAMLRKELPKMEDGATEGAAPIPGLGPEGDASEYDSFVSAFTELLCQSQIYVREVNSGERSVVSMRDIARAAKVFKWFLTYYSKLRGVAFAGTSDDKDGGMRLNLNTDMRPHLRSAMVLTLGYCYHSRLDRDQRWGYRRRLCETWQRLKTENARVEWLRLETGKDLEDMLVQTQLDFVSQMDLGEGIALNEALRENLFMLLVSIMNQIPILLIGKPGCSKSLAMGVLQNNLNGDVSNKEFFKSMPAVDVLAYQCSPLSTPDAILNTFDSARQSNIGNKKTIVCVLLDEVGLAEESPHLPLKVLHRELEDLQGIACVGISNWALDAAKMSRCVTLYRPPPTVQDLCVTAAGMVASENLKSYLSHLSEAFFEMYKAQKRADFWGMREFYSTVRVINTELKARMARGQDAALEERILMKTVQRNFGGRPPGEVQDCIEEFFERMGMDWEPVEKFTTAQLIQQNLSEPDARHLMLLTKNNAALRLLFESGLADYSTSEVMFGSTFPNDQSDIFVAINLQRIKSFMQQPISLVMVHCDSLYESLYDLLNQHYMEYAGQRYVRIAHGSKAKQCPIHRQFRVIVVTEINDAYFRLAPPLLNRFEKHIFLRKDLMESADEVLLNRLTKFWDSLSDCMRQGGDEPAAAAPAGAAEEHSSQQQHRPIAGWHNELLSSLVFMLRRRAGSEKSLDVLFEEAKRLLTKVLTPEAACIIAAALTPIEMESRFGFDLVTEYFDKQRHSDLPSFAEALASEPESWCDDFGAQVMVLTYSPIRGKIGQELQKVLQATPMELSLHELSSSQDIEKSVQQFYDGAPRPGKGEGEKRFLLIHADPVAASPRMIEHSRFVCEKARSDFVKSGRGIRGTVFVILVVHLQRGMDSSFSFDYDSQWHYVFLDSVEPSGDLNSMPSLGKLKNMPLIDVVSDLEFPRLLQSCFRASLSRLIYPHSRRPDDLQKQIHSILVFLEDREFVTMVRNWILLVLRQTPKNASRPAEGTVGQDKNWFATIATAAHELALAGTFRAALHNRVAVLVGSLLTVLLAHLDRNGGLALLADSEKRELWLNLAEASLHTDLSARLHNEAVTATQEVATAQHEVGTDAQTGARPFTSRFPSSWFVSRSIDGMRHVIETLPLEQQTAALATQYQLSKLHDVGLQTESLLDDYLSDFTAMHVDWAQRMDRDTQTRILKKTLQRMKGGELKSILEIHQLFWSREKHVAQSISLLNAVPNAVPGAEELIDTASLSTLTLDLLLLVHSTLTAELQQESSSGAAHGFTEPVHFYREWLSRKMVVAGFTKDLLLESEGVGVGAEQLSKLRCNTEPRIETCALFLEYVAVPLNLPLELVRELANELPEGKIRQAGTLGAILKVAKKVCDHGGDSARALGAYGAFVESWLLDVALRDAAAISDLEEECLRLCCSLAAGLPVVFSGLAGVQAGKLEELSEAKECGIAALGTADKVIPRSECLNLALLRKLIVASEGEAREKATKRIEELLALSRKQQHSDTAFATRYTVLCEEEASAELSKLAGPTEWPSTSLGEVFGNLDKSQSPARMLREIGRIRFLLAEYAGILCQENIDLVRHDQAVEKLNPLLMTEDERLKGICRSLRLYLLKCVERCRGISFLRDLLAKMPLSGTQWVTRWRDTHDIDFEKFIGAAMVPKWNPFMGDENTAEYREAKNVIADFQITATTANLDKYAQACARKDPVQQKRDIAGLLMALCQEPGLLAALEKPPLEEGEVEVEGDVLEHRPPPPPWRLIMNQWLASCKHLPVSDKERMLLRIFAGDASSLKEVPSPDREYLAPFIISGGRKMDDLLRWRLLGHLAGALIASQPSSVLSALRKIMLEPHELMNGANTYLPGMDEDIRNRVMKALLERGENIWKFKSHWYKCTCGYTFFIGECGRPMEVTSCPQCSLQIGGRDHSKTQATQEDDEKDRSPQGYMLPSAEKDEKHVSFREVPASSARAVRLLLHGAMFLGIASHAGSPMPRIFDHVVNRDSMCTMHHDSEAKYIGEHFANDFKLMVELLSSNVEDLAAGLHDLFRKMSAEPADSPKGSPPTHTADLNWEKLNLELRNKWEETIEGKYLGKMVKDFDTQLQGLYQKWGGAEEDGKFVAELKEAADVRDFMPSKREQEMPQLWAYRTPVTLDMLHARMGALRDPQETFPVLCTVLQRPLFPVLPALGMLVGIFEWHSMVINRFSGRITRNAAGELKVGEVLDSIRNPAEKLAWERAFSQFERAWHIAWPYVERHECLEIPQHFRTVAINRDSSMIYCIADPENEGLCPLALTQWLAAQHNELVQVVSTATTRPSRPERQAHRNAVDRVSSRLLGMHDVVKYDEGELMRFLQSRCVTYGVGGRLNFDFKQLEQQLRRELARPEITVELRGFQWLGEAFALTSELKAVIKQKDLMPDVVERLKNELNSPSLANRCLQKVQMASSFIQKSGSFSSEHAGETLLSEYLRAVLAESHDSIPSQTARSEVYLWHLTAFEKVLKQIINQDPMDAVDPKYRADLPEDLLEALLRARPALPVPSLLEHLAYYAEEHLKNTYLSDETPILEFLSATEAGEDAEHWPTLQAELPTTLQMKHWVSVYRVLKTGKAR